jgi:glyoxylase-like metal-dependent hydrolase (beta-lactamase superfamily II)
MYLIIGSEKALVIDCGIGIGDFKGVIKELTDLPYDVVISHAHVDHIGGRGQFEKLYLHKDDIVHIPKITDRFRRNYKWACIQGSKRFIKSKLIKVLKEPLIIGIEDGHIFNLGNRTVRAIHTPGHTLGSLCFIIEEDKILLTCDNFNPVLLMFLNHCDTIENYVKSGEKILSYKGLKLYYGSHLRSPISYEIMETTVNAARLILKKRKKNTKRYHFRVQFKDKTTISYRTDNIFNK